MAGHRYRQEAVDLTTGGVRGYNYNSPFSRLQACNKSHTVSFGCITFITRLVRGRRDIKHIIII